MECGQFVGKVKPETWWVNPWDFQKFATKGGAALGAADGIVNFGDSIWRWKPCFFSKISEVEFVLFFWDD